MRRTLLLEQNWSIDTTEPAEDLLTHLVLDQQVLPLRGTRSGNKSTGFGLKKSSEEEVHKSTGSREQTKHLDLKIDPDKLYEQLCQCTGKQYHLDRIGGYAVYLSYGLVTSGKKISIPVLLIPVRLLPLPGSNRFCISYDGGELCYNPQLTDAGIRTENLPQLPSALEDIQFDNLKSDLYEFFIPYNKHTFSNAVQFHPAGLNTPEPARKPAGFGFGSKNKRPVAPEVSPLTFLNHTGYLPLMPPGRLSVSVIHALSNHRNPPAYNAASLRERHEAIVNTISWALQNGRPAIVVSDQPEPMLSVEEEFLDAGLYEAILPLYRLKNRRHWIGHLHDTFDMSLEDTPASSSPGEAPQNAIEDLNRLEQALAEPYGKMQLHPAHLAAKLRSSATRPLFTLPIEQPSEIAEEDIERYQEFLKQYLSIRKTIGNTEEHPWNWVQTPELSQEQYDEVIAKWERAAQVIRSLQLNLNRLAKRIGLTPAGKTEDIERFTEICRFIRESPRLDIRQFEVTWNPRPETVQELFSLIAKGAEKTESIKMYFQPEILEENLTEKVPRLFEQSRKLSRYLKWSYQKEVEHLISYGVNNSVEENGLLWYALHEAMELQQIHQRLQQMQSEGQRLFGIHWNGINSNIGLLEEQISWLQRYQASLETYRELDSAQLRHFIVTRKEFDLRELRQITELKEEFDTTLTRLSELLRDTEDSPLQHAHQTELPELQEWFNHHRQHMENLTNWVAWQLIQQLPEYNIIGFFLRRAGKQRNIKWDELSTYLEQLFRYTILEAVRSERPVLHEATAGFAEGRLEELWQHVEQLQSGARAELQNRIQSSRSAAVGREELKPELEVLRHELQKYSRHRSISHILKQAANALMHFYPIWMIRRDQIDQLPQQISAHQPVWIGIDPPEPEMLSGTQHDGLICTFHSKPEDAGIDPPLRLPHEVSFKEVNPSRNGKQIHEEAAADLVKAMVGEDDSNSRFACLSENSEEPFWPGYIHEIQQSCNTLPEAEAALNAARLKLLERPLTPAKKQMLMDATGTGKPNALLASLFQKDGSAADITIYTGGSKQKEQLNKIAATRGMDINRDRQPANLVISFMDRQLGADWHIIPSDQNPLTAFITHRSHPGLSYTTFTYAGTDKEGIWEQFLKLRPFCKPVFMSSIQHGGELENRVEGLLHRLENDLNTYTEPSEDHKPAPGFGFHKPEPAREEPEEKTSAQATAQPAVYPDTIKQLTQPPSQYPLDFATLKSRKLTRTIDLGQMPALPEYKLHQGPPMGTREDFLNAPEEELRPLMQEIVEVETPIHWRNLMRCFASYWQIQKLNQNVEVILFQLIANMLEDKQMFAKDNCLYDNEQFLFKLRSRKSTLAYHHLEEIPLDELEYALYALIQKFQPVDQTQLMKEAARYIGFPRLSPPLRYHMETALGRMAHARVIGMARNGLRLHN